MSNQRSHLSARGFTLVEVCVSVLLVAGLLAASLEAVGASKTGQYQLTERARGNALARALLAEIVQMAYLDPGSSPVFGPESGQTRATFDDVDDYNGYSESPPAAKDGTAIAIPAATSWRRTVTVAYVNPQTLASGAVSETGAKLITVTALHGAKPVATIRAIRASAP